MFWFCFFSRLLGSIDDLPPLPFDLVCNTAAPVSSVVPPDAAGVQKSAQKISTNASDYPVESFTYIVRFRVFCGTGSTALALSESNGATPNYGNNARAPFGISPGKFEPLVTPS